MPPRPLTKKELKLQKKKGQVYRDLLQEAVSDTLPFYKKPALCLSGGVDSTTTLWCMIEAGARPGIISYTVPGVPHSKDLKRAIHLAEYYDLDMHIIELPSNPDKIVKGLIEIGTTYYQASDRGDYECMWMMSYLFKQAKKLGYDAVYAGMVDSGIHILGREMEILGRADQLSLTECNLHRFRGSVNQQYFILSHLGQKIGIDVVLPINMASRMIPYYNVPWLVMNRPRNKYITMSAFEKEKEESALKYNSAPMQCGDSGAREYFDTKVPESKHAQKMVGEPFTGSMKFYNALYRFKHGDGRVKSKRREHWDVWRFGTQQRPIEKGGVDFEINEEGRAVYPNEEEVGFLDVGLDNIKCDDHGNPDSRIDCWFNPFWELDGDGDPKAWVNCERAQAGLCGRPGTQPPIQSSACEFSTSHVDLVIEDLDDVINLYPKGSGLKKVLKKWRKRTVARFEELSQIKDAEELKIIQKKS